MEKAVSVSDANRKFSQLLRDVREGQSYVVTNHGKPVARIAHLHEHRRAWAIGRTRLLNRLKSQRITKIGPLKREDLYEKQ
jgi:prevent-host-death family protein